MPKPSDRAIDKEQRSERVFLKHLEEVKSTSGNTYYNQHFLGRGGNGTAFLVTAKDGPHAGLQFALKLLHRLSEDTRKEAFTREAAHLKSLNHPAIVRMFDEGVLARSTGAHPFVVMEFIPTTMRVVLNRRELGRLSAIRGAMHCLSALSHLHSRQPPIIHRDIKPENILLSNGTAKLADFGLAKALLDEDAAPRIASGVQDVRDVQELSQRPGMPARYRTPELVARARGEKIVLTSRSDIYQMGTVLYELLTGTNPQMQTAEKLNDIKLDVRDLRGAQAAELSALVHDMLARVPEDRPDAATCLKRLDAIHREVCNQSTQLEGDFV